VTRVSETFLTTEFIDERAARRLTVRETPDGLHVRLGGQYVNLDREAVAALYSRAGRRMQFDYTTTPEGT
jgi:hypothetical protein